MAAVRTVDQTLQYEGEEYTLTFDWTVIAEFEEANGWSVADVLKPPQGGSPLISRLVKLFLAGLQHNHPEADLNLAGAMMTTPAIAAKFNGAIDGAMPQAGDVAGEDGKPASANPPNRRTRRAAQSGTGKGRSAGKIG
jgi:hypothetical protein